MKLFMIGIITSMALIFTANASEHVEVLNEDVKSFKTILFDHLTNKNIEYNGKRSRYIIRENEILIGWEVFAVNDDKCALANVVKHPKFSVLSLAEVSCETTVSSVTDDSD